MSGKYPNDRVREATDVPETYDRHRERFSESEAARLDADDPVSGARPETEPAEPPQADPSSEEDDSDRG